MSTHRYFNIKQLPESHIALFHAWAPMSAADYSSGSLRAPLISRPSILPLSSEYGGHCALSFKLSGQHLAGAWDRWGTASMV